MHYASIMHIFAKLWFVNTPQSTLVIFNSLKRVILTISARRFTSRHRTNFKHQLKCISLTDEPFALALSPEAAAHAPNSLPPPLDPAPRGSTPWFTLDLATTIFIDARSPCEYAIDHIEGAINIPILSDQERVEVGKIFSSGDVVKARLLGARFACANIAESLRPEGPLTRFFETSDQETCSPLLIVVYCFRGGQRSMGLGTILSELNCSSCEVACLAGGYRAWRRLLLRQLGVWPTLVAPGGLAGTLWVLSSLTGCGKTLLLEELEAVGESTLNLEQMAGHKGSMFGGGGMQPTQQIFDARLHSALQRCLTAPHVWTECESRNIGPGCKLGDGFWQRLRGTRATVRVWLSAPLEARVNWILHDYAAWLHNSEENMERIFESMANYHSKKRLESWRKLVRGGDYAAFVAEVLEHHYDPLYKKSRGSMLCHYADMGLLHCIEVPIVDRAYFRKEVIPHLQHLSIHSSRIDFTHRDNALL
ncbi:tRNA 2 selenouridine synthase [Echinococcus multilocularis]|uniref:tRNA 2 selenouridine synthase n=1 Tax=Echinococcus multilocularis TaxID=6211 RepID=A0A068YB45_ECHMU|nr:tRNA 2 selenouridine synthase [Echinococcus multilocularis]